MRVEIRRGPDDPHSVPSQVFVDGVFECYGLEPARTNPVIPGHPAIPAGEYEVRLTLSPKFGYVTPEVISVPGRTAIRWHPANWPKELEGCMAPGESQTTDAVWNSRAAWDKLMTLLQPAWDRGEKITAVYIDPPPVS